MLNIGMRANGFTKSMKNYNALVLFVFLCVLVNVVSIVYFKFRMARDYDISIKLVREESQEAFTRFATDVLSRVDGYLYTNSLNSVSSPLSASEIQEKKPFFEVVDHQFNYFYFIDNGVAFADVAGDYYRVGDSFPRGGVITALSRDSILVDNKYLFINSNRSAHYLASTERNPKKLDKNVDSEALRWRN